MRESNDKARIGIDELGLVGWRNRHAISLRKKVWPLSLILALASAACLVLLWLIPDGKVWGLSYLAGSIVWAMAGVNDGGKRLSQGRYRALRESLQIDPSAAQLLSVDGCGISGPDVERILIKDWIRTGRYARSWTGYTLYIVTKEIIVELLSVRTRSKAEEVSHWLSRCLKVPAEFAASLPGQGTIFDPLEWLRTTALVAPGLAGVIGLVILDRRAQDGDHAAVLIAATVGLWIASYGFAYWIGRAEHRMRIERRAGAR